MTLLTTLERKFGWIAIGNLPVYVVTAQAMIYIWTMINPEQAHLLSLDPLAVRYGHDYWRFLTFLFMVPVQNPIFAFFFLYLLYVYGVALEQEWGSFRFTIFYLIGAIGTVISAFFFGSQDGSFFINTSIFLAFAAIHPDMQLLLFFILPIKVKWLAWITWLWLGYHLLINPIQVKAAILISLANYFAFFGWRHIEQIKEKFQAAQHRYRFRDWK